MQDYRVHTAGDTALVVEFGDRVDRKINDVVLALAHSLSVAQISGINELVPTFRSLMIHYEPLLLSFDVLVARIEEQVRDLNPAVEVGHVWQLPVCYDSRLAMDLNDVARRTSLAPSELIERHSLPTYHVYMLGFLPGQAYFGEIAAELALDRRVTPRTRIPAGSLAIASTMSCVFPLETPCGWHVIGRCPVPLWDFKRATALLAPGDKVRIAPISLREYEALSADVSQNGLNLKPVGEFVGAAA